LAELYRQLVAEGQLASCEVRQRFFEIGSRRGIEELDQRLACQRRAIFLDRDGVINETVLRDGNPGPPANLKELRLVSGLEDCLAELKRAGFLLIVVTNQPDIARGLQDRTTLEEIHGFLRARLPIDEIFVCEHDDGDDCDCRKPRPGMLLDAAQRHNVNLERSFLIGDRWRDIEAGAHAGCSTVLIDYGYPGKRAQADFETNCLRGAVDWILRRSSC